MAVVRLGFRWLWMVPVASALGLARPLPVAAQTPDPPLYGISELKLGALYHDVPGLWSGFSLERPAADANVEVLFVPWAWTFGGYLRPAVGATVNFNGDTSKAYADLRWEIEASSGVFLAFGMGAAIHDGDINAVDNQHKALGSRVLFHPSAELGYRFDGVNSISLFADHMSNGFTQQYNDGLDTIGIRFGHKFAPTAAPPQEARQEPLVADFSGPYIGAFAGYQYETADWYSSPAVSAARSGFAWGGFAGINWQSGKGIFGLEADALPATRNFAVGCGTAGISCQMDISGVYSVGPKFGWVIGSTMVYGTGGVALAPWQSRVVNPATAESLDHANGLNYGVAVGAGVEHKLAPNLTVRGEFMHYGIAGWDLNVPAAGITANQFQSSVARVGFAWYFH